MPVLETKISLIAGILGGIVTIITSVGGAYMTTKVTLARHDIEIIYIKNQLKEVEIIQKEDTKILMRIEKAVAVIEERTKKD